MTDFDRLLNPNSMPPDLSAARPIIEGATVLVTGAGGSIGSEVCRLLLTLHPAALLLLGRGENSIYHMHQELSEREHGQTELLPIIADVRDRPRCAAVIIEHRPTVVIHTAAHKHVPMMEANPSEAVACNVFGTASLLDACEVAGSVERLVLVSTDKAVNPVSIMGATKRIAELLVRERAERTGRAYCTVRLGNVFGSRGSVYPLWRRQIAAGRSVTVTHPDITRYFITIADAAAFIVRSVATSTVGATLIPDMGDPVRIYELAEEVIRRCGGASVPMRFTGVRPGEKLHEQLHDDHPCALPPREQLQRGLIEFETMLGMGIYAADAWRDMLGRVLLGYRPELEREAVGVR